MVARFGARVYHHCDRHKSYVPVLIFDPGESGLTKSQSRPVQGETRISTPLASPVVQKSEPVLVRNGLGLAFMGAGFFLFSAADALAKLLTETMHPIQIVWSRQLGLVFGVVILLLVRGPSILRTKNPGLQITRGVLAVCSATLFIFAVGYVPLADAVAVTFVAPFMVTIMGALILREKVGPRRWAAVAVGFIGTMIVIRPGSGVMHPAMFLVLLAATSFALRQVLSRMLAGSDSTATTIAYTSLTASLIATVPLPFVWHWPETRIEIAWLVGMAVVAGLGELLVIKALEVAQAVVIAPLHYSMMIWGTMYGVLVFGQWPDMWTWVGATIIVATGLYILYRERLVGKQARAANKSA